MTEVKLYRMNSLGIGTWRIWASGDELLYAHATVEGGAEVLHSEKIFLNQSGRSLEQQIKLQMESRISRQMNKGYKHSRAEALAQGSTNQLGLLNPMLAQPLEKVRSFAFNQNTFVQPKFDGHRCLITKQDGDVVAYSRKGKIITTIDHIIEGVSSWLPEGLTLDGELYVHGKSLQTISSLIKRKQPESALLNYHFYDVTDTSPFVDRLKLMFELISLNAQPAIQLVPTHAAQSLDEVYNHFRKWRAEGYEGAMIRRSTRGYEDAKRSDQLIKVKERQDAEAVVVGITASKDNWAILNCVLPNGVGFDVSAPGTVIEKTDVLLRKDAFIGRQVTIEYAYLTADGRPFHAVATRWKLEV